MKMNNILCMKWGDKYDETGCPMLLNTPLNIKGMPIVDTWNDAMEFSKLYNVQVF
jgi:predicted NodU family carbamoyl transferase